MHLYSKGYRSERELLHLLYKQGWAVIRAPRSGRVGIPTPDIVAAKAGRLVVIECKSRAEAFAVEKEQLLQLAEWEQRAGAKAYIGWKQSRKGWSFLRLNDVQKNNGNVGKAFAEEKGIKMESI
ncbi:MAG: hypothetical protein HYW25_02620 [Candidatus Aenigmarchaeota archaeon]|nr:hypothetical protein [Candidatus Aenigmarchaeota archaeon]